MKTKHTRNTVPKEAEPPEPAAPEIEAEFPPGKDFTGEILEFLQGAHGKIRLDSIGDYYYEKVSTISLHFLLKSRLPAKEVLWQWYRYFDRDRSESIYQTLPPLRDVEFLEILAACPFRWDREAVEQSGLVFLDPHRKEVYLELEGFISMRLDAYETMSDAELAAILTPQGTWSQLLLRKLIRKIQTQSLTTAERQAIYDQLESDYLKATARHLIDEALTESFWKAPPTEMEALARRFIIFARTMANTARRLGVYHSRKEYEETARRNAWEQSRQAHGKGGNHRRPYRAGNFRGTEEAYFQTLGLESSASLMEVKNAYREKVKQHHPDQGGSVREFLRLQEAYEYLLTQVF